MAKKRSKEKEVLRKTSPKGKALYPFLFKPSTKFDEDGVFKIGLVLNLDDHGVKEYLKAIKEFRDEVEAGPKLPFTIDKEANTATVNFKSSRAPTVVDREKEVLKKDPQTGNGSTIRVSAAFAPYEGFGGGITAYLNAVQIIKNIPYAPGVNDFDVEDGEDVDGGFGDDEEAGYDADGAGADDDDIPF